MPTLESTNLDGMTQRAETNEDKSQILAATFFPPKPTTSQVPNNYKYPTKVAYCFQLHETQLWRQINKLKPHKAPGDHGIPNIVLKESIDLIAGHLLWIYRAVFTLETYSARWKSWVTIALRKPGKANYNAPKCYCPIALYNTMGKLLTVIVMEDMVHLAEKHCLLPANHFGGRPGITRRLR